MNISNISGLVKRIVAGLIFSLALVGYSLMAESQDNHFELIDSIVGRTQYIETDYLGNCYTVDNTSLKLYNKEYKFQKSYSNQSLGSISFVDVLNPLKILVFFADFKTIVFLDNTLSINGSEVNLTSMNLGGASLACSSHNNGIWVYDQDNMGLVRLDQNLQVTNQSGSIAQYSNSKEFNPNFLIESGNFVYLNNPSEGIMVFDGYGNYVKLLPFKQLTSFDVFQNKLIFMKANKLTIYDIALLKEDLIDLSEFGNSLSAKLIQNRIFLQKENGVFVISYR